MSFDLFTYAERYPHAPGTRGISSSNEAAEIIKPCAATLRAKVLAYLQKNGPATTREICAAINEDYASIQPRTSELRRLNKIKDSGQRRKEGRVNVIVWGVV